VVRPRANGGDVGAGLEVGVDVDYRHYGRRTPVTTDRSVMVV
jgi:hypothetical protein